MEIAELTDLYLAQKDLDQTIANNHNITYATTRRKRCMALLVEIGEFANVTRCFKYWSNKSAEAKDVVLDEYADGLHFFLSLGIDIGSKQTSFEINRPTNSLTDQFLLVYDLINTFVAIQDVNSYIKAFSAFLNILPLLGYKWNDLKNAYFKKLDTNYHRQETNY